MVQYWTEQSRGVVEHSDLKDFKTRLGKTTVHIIYSHFVWETRKAVSTGPFWLAFLCIIIKDFCLCTGSAWTGATLATCEMLGCFVFVAGKVLVPHQSAGCCWAVPAQHQGSLSQHHIKGWEWARVGRVQSWHSWPDLIKEMAHTMWCQAQRERLRKVQGWGICYKGICFTMELLPIVGPSFLWSDWTSPADGMYTIHLLVVWGF